MNSSKKINKNLEGEKKVKKPTKQNKSLVSAKAEKGGSFSPAPAPQRQPFLRIWHEAFFLYYHNSPPTILVDFLLAFRGH